MKPNLRPLILAALLAGCAVQRPNNQLELTLVGLNDLHGNLEASSFEKGKAGGIDALAATLQAWRKDDPDLLLVGAGDMIGASPAMSGMFADEPTLKALGLMGMRATSVGNHEFDNGKVELLRQARGGCANSPRPEKACQFNPAWEGAKFSYLAANVIDTQTGQPLLPAYRIEEVKGVKIAFIGTVLKDTPDLINASGNGGLQFIDEAQAVNRLLPELRAQGATVFVVLIHQGGKTKMRYDQQYCDDLGGDIADVVKRLDPAVRLVVSGHSHKGYLCRVDGRLVTQAEKYGHMLSRISLVVDRQTGAVVGSSAISSVGLQASAMAITTRWRMPPDSWCGWRPSTFLASGMRTRSSMRSASARAAWRESPWCRRMDSAICSPTVNTGFSEVMGSWNTMARSAPRRLRICDCDARARSRRSPLRRVSHMLPLPRRPPPCSTRRMRASEDTDLPEPDSPTMASVSPAST